MARSISRTVKRDKYGRFQGKGGIKPFKSNLKGKTRKGAPDKQKRVVGPRKQISGTKVGPKTKVAPVLKKNAPKKAAPKKNPKYLTPRQRAVRANLVAGAIVVGSIGVALTADYMQRRAANEFSKRRAYNESVLKEATAAFKKNKPFAQAGFAKVRGKSVQIAPSYLTGLPWSRRRVHRISKI
jgi:hypothetical protein